MAFLMASLYQPTAPTTKPMLENTINGTLAVPEIVAVITDSPNPNATAVVVPDNNNLVIL